jgi:hypothetical protein
MNKIYKRFGKTPSPPHLVKSELTTNLGSGNFIFVGSSIDLFAHPINKLWQRQVIDRALDYPNNTYLWHTKNPCRAVEILPVQDNFILCATIESDNVHSAMCFPTFLNRMRGIDNYRGRSMITIEPIMDFNVWNFSKAIIRLNPEQVNIGADTGNNHLPEPPKEKILELIAELEKFTKVYQKKNLGRLLK